MFVKREGVPETIAGLVKQNTGMSTETLMKDMKKYRIDGLSQARDMIQAAMRENATSTSLEIMMWTGSVAGRS